MNFEEQISAFMDGALTAGEETEFLHILSVSPEKRALFHSFMGTRSAFATDARSAAVPSNLDMAILGAAGAIGAAAGGAASGGAAAGGAASGGAAAGGAIGAAGAAGTIGTGGAAGALGASGAAGAALSGAAFWTAGRVITAIILGLSLFTSGWYLNDIFSPGVESSTGADVTTAPTSPSVPSASEADQATENPRTETTEATSPGDPAGTPRIVYRNVYVTRVDTVFVPRQETVAASEPMVIQRYDTVLVALMQTVQDQRPITITEQPYAVAPVSLPGRFEVELQREHLTTYPYIDYGRIGADRTQQQFAASIGYVFSERHAAGIVAGEKSFAMEYYRVENDSLFLFQRQPALFYGAGFYRYSQPLLAGVTPELTLQIGGCDFGPVFGARLGVRFDPLERISLILGANGTLLAYKYKDKLFTSHSLGISYGIRYRF